MKKFTQFIFVFLIVPSLLFYKCSTSDQTLQTKMPVREKIPPGSAIILCNVDSSVENGDDYLIEVNVKSVLGYGSATKEIAPNTNMKLQMSKYLIELNSLKKGTELKLEISQPKMKMETEMESVWTVSSLIKK